MSNWMRNPTVEIIHTPEAYIRFMGPIVKIQIPPYPEIETSKAMFEKVIELYNKADQVGKGEEEMEDKGLISDGYHTFNELYEHRHMLFRALCKNFPSWKSRQHSDGTMFEGWFIAGVRSPKEEHDITYHIPMRLWELFNIHEVEKAPIFDGHSSQDVIERLKDF